MGNTYLAFRSKCGWNLPDWDGDMEIWWTTNNVCFGLRGQKEMCVPPASLNTTCRIWSPSVEFSSLSAIRLSRQGKHPYWCLKSHSPVAESSLWQSKYFSLPVILHTCAHPGLLLPWRQSLELKYAKLKREDHRDFCGTGFWTLNNLPCCSPAGQASGEVNTKTRSVCIFERYFLNTKINKEGGGKQRKSFLSDH